MARVNSYELPALYNAWMLQYRPDKGTCVHRMFDDANGTRWVDEWLYGKRFGLLFLDAAVGVGQCCDAGLTEWLFGWVLDDRIEHGAQ